MRNYIYLNMSTVQNPFLLTGYQNESLFCNRKTEREFIIRNASNGINTTLFAIRRLGKTGLLAHSFHKLSKNKKFVCIYIDIYGTRNLKDFTNTLATAIYKRFPENRGIGKSIVSFIKQLRPVISIDPLDGSPELSLEMSKSEIPKTIQQVFQFLDKQNVKVIIAIDEFQQILEYPEKNTEAILRTYIQVLKNVHFIFAGSNQKMMYEIFQNAKRPFYASCSNLTLGYISEKDYREFIQKIFREKKRKISVEAIDFILQWTSRHTYYTQLICNRIYADGFKNIQLDDVQKICKNILDEMAGNYYQYRNLLTRTQWDLLKAIAREEKVSQLHSRDFLRKHGLGTTSTISRTVESLLEKELIYREINAEESYYMLNDKFLMRWLQMN